nr:similar to MamL [Magnetovibrio blakemorei]
MLKMLLYLVIVTLIIIFASQNLADVNVYLIAGRPAQMPLVLVIGLSFFTGFAMAIVTVIRRAIRRPKRDESKFLQSRPE